MKDIILNGQIIRDVYDIAVYNELGEKVILTEENELIPTTDASLFKYDNGIIIEYLGDASSISLPRSYSIDKIEKIEGAFINYDYLFYFNQASTTISDIAVTDGILTKSYIDGTDVYNNLEIDFPDGNTKIISFKYISGTGILRLTRALIYPIYYQELEFKNYNLFYEYLINNTEPNSDIRIAGNKYSFKNGRDYKVTGVGASAFKNNLTLTSIDLTTCLNLTSIGDHAFSGCTGLISITLPDTLISIGKYAFSDCSNIEGELILPKNLEIIEPYTFYGCRKINKITWPENLLEIRDHGLCWMNLEREVVIPNTVQILGPYAISSNPNINSLIIGTSVIEIGEGAFYNLSGISELIIPDSVEKIGHESLRGMSSLQTIYLGSNLNFINLYAFNDCNSLTQAIFKVTTGWKVINREVSGYPETELSSESLSNAYTAATYLKSTYWRYIWERV